MAAKRRAAVASSTSRAKRGKSADSRQEVPVNNNVSQGKAAESGATTSSPNPSTSVSTPVVDERNQAESESSFASMSRGTADDRLPFFTDSVRRPSFYVPEDIQLMIGRLCIATWSDQELWFGLSRVNRLFRGMVERDIVSGRPRNEKANSEDSQADSGTQSDVTGANGSSEPLYTKFPFQTTGETTRDYAVGFAERKRGVYNLVGVRDDFQQFKASSWSAKVAGPYMWFHMIANWHPLRSINHSFTGINRLMSLDRLRGNVQGSPDFYQAVFCSVGELTYKQMSAEEAHDHSIRTGEHMEAGTYASYLHPSLAKLRSSKRDLLLQFDSTGKKFGVAPQSEAEKQRGKHIDFWVCALSEDGMIHGGRVENGFTNVHAVDCEIDAEDPSEALLYLVIDWREMWTKKLGRERAAEAYTAAYEQALASWRKTLSGKLDYSQKDYLKVPMVDIDGEKAILRLHRRRSFDEPQQNKVWQLPDGIGGQKHWAFGGVERDYIEGQDSRERWYLRALRYRS